MGLIDIWNKVKSSESFRPARIHIPATNIDPPMRVADAFERNELYFEVSINQLFLTYDRKWAKTYDPIVFVISKFQYDGKYHEVPFMVGQSVLEGQMEKTPQGMLFENTKVAGLHPYKGGTFSLTVILGRALRENYLRKVLNIIENTSKTYLGAFGTSVLQYSNVAKIVLNAFEDLMSSKDVEPVIGHQISINPDTEGSFSPGYYALINKAEGDIDPSKFWIKNSKLYYGNSLNDAELYYDADYVLYSILAATNRSDIETLGYYSDFNDLRTLVTAMGNTIDENERTLINGKLFALCDKVRMSPDLTRPQIKKQIQLFRDEIKELIDSRQPLSGHESAKVPRDAWEEELDAQLLNIIT